MLVLAAAALVAVTVTIHSVGLAALYLAMVRREALQVATSGRAAWGLVRVTWALIAIHAIEIALWAACYRWLGALPDLETALYFSGVSYTTLGYGDVVLPERWRLLAPLEGLVGILMAGLSTGFFFAVVSRLSANAHPGRRDRAG
jgi:hypothetical protein